MKKVAECFGFGLLILLMTSAALTFLAPRLGWRVDAVHSGSMEPQLKVGGLVITRPAEAEEIRIGDTITFLSPVGEQLISHRVIALEDGLSHSFRTKGDANEETDPFILPADHVVGKVCFHIPYLGYIAQYVKTPLGLLFMLCLPGVAIIIIEIRNIWRVFAAKEIERKHRAR